MDQTQEHGHEHEHEQEHSRGQGRVRGAHAHGHGHGHGHGQPTDINPEGITDPTEFWEARYLANRGDRGQVWSGRVNASVEREVSDLTPGTALELGSGEGGDALWLAARGWTVTALDISATALAVGAAKAADEGLADRIAWTQADLATWHPSSQYDLVTAAFLHSPVELPRDDILRRATTAVAPGGRLLVVGHGAFPPWSSHNNENTPPLPTADEVLDSLALPDGWVVETSAQLDRVATAPDGQSFEITDAVVRVRRSR